MNANDYLREVKTRLMITGSDHDELLMGYIEDAKGYLTDAGVDTEELEALGVLARGVADMWNFGAGDGRFSEIFYQRATQLSFKQKRNEK